jgi:hypothetical protein
MATKQKATPRAVNQKFMNNLEKARAINSAVYNNNKPATSRVVYLHNTSATAPATTPVQPEREVPFYPFTPDFPTWEGDAAFTGSDYLLLNKPKDKTTGKDPLKDPAKPSVFMTPRVTKEVQYIVDKAEGEVAWMFLSKQIAPKSRTYLIYDYFLANQDASGAHVDLDMEDVARYTDYLKETFPEQWPDGNIAQDLHHGHSHASMPVFWSGTDTKQQESKDELGFQNDYRFFLVFNKHKEVYASMVVYSPVFFRVDDIHVGIYTGDGTTQNVELSCQRKKELDEKMAALVKKPVHVTYNYYNRHDPSNPGTLFGYNHYTNYQAKKWQGARNHVKGDKITPPIPNNHNSNSLWDNDRWGEDFLFDDQGYENFSDNYTGREAPAKPSKDTVAAVEQICLEEITNYYAEITEEPCLLPAQENYKNTIIKKAMDIPAMQELYTLEFFSMPTPEELPSASPRITPEMLVGYLVDVSDEFTFGEDGPTSEDEGELPIMDLITEVMECLMQLMQDLEETDNLPILGELVNVADILAERAAENYTDGPVFIALERSI